MPFDDDYELAHDQPCATVSPRELRALARRLTKLERPELAAAGRAIDKMLAGEIVTRDHHDRDFDPARCAACLPDRWTAYAIGVAFPDVDTEDLDRRFAGLWGLTGENLELAIDDGRNEQIDPHTRHRILALSDAHRDEWETVRAELQPGCWYRNDWDRWVRDFDRDPQVDPEVDALIASIKATQSADMDRLILGTPGARGMRDGTPTVGTDRELINEIRFGSDPRTARTAKRSALKKDFDSSWLI
jgi:hypothetical protein